MVVKNVKLLAVLVFCVLEAEPFKYMKWTKNWLPMELQLKPWGLILVYVVLCADNAGGWPMLTPLKLQKCEKCSREFYAPINYRRHMRLHRRALNFDKVSLDVIFLYITLSFQNNKFVLFQKVIGLLFAYVNHLFPI